MRFTPVALLTLALSFRAGAQDRVVSLAGREVAVWEGKGTGAARAPILFFSHGFGGCASGSNFLKSALAARGYWVFAPRHADAGCVARSAAPVPAVSFSRPAEWSDATYVSRANDILAVHGALQATPAFAGRLDFSRVGYVGHSLGGYTVLGLVGGWSAWGRAPGVRAVLALSPYIEPFLAHRTLGGIGVPVMFQGGTADDGITPYVARRGGAYEQTPAPKYLVVFRGATHNAWGDRRNRSHDGIVAYSIAFLDHHVRGMRATEALTTVRPEVSELRFEAGTR
jgi:predicted dienelactone hydrolase